MIKDVLDAGGVDLRTGLLFLVSSGHNPRTDNRLRCRSYPWEVRSDWRKETRYLIGLSGWVGNRGGGLVRRKALF